MSLRVVTDPDQIAVTYESAAKAIDMSIDVIRRAVRKGDLVPRYPTSRPLILVDELKAWVESAPQESPAERAAS